LCRLKIPSPQESRNISAVHTRCSTTETIQLEVQQDKTTQRKQVVRTHDHVDDQLYSTSLTNSTEKIFSLIEINLKRHKL
jgi:hypothetical protein